jgi:hypothetical protein
MDFLNLNLNLNELDFFDESLVAPSANLLLPELVSDESTFTKFISAVAACYSGVIAKSYRVLSPESILAYSLFG